MGTGGGKIKPMKSRTSKCWLGLISLGIALLNDQAVQADTNGAPVITLQPVNQVVAAGGTVNLSVTATGNAPLAYQWFKNDRILLPATNSTLILAGAGVPDSGVYRVVITNSSGMSISQPVTVMVGNPQFLAWGFDLFGELGDGTTTIIPPMDLPETITSNVVAAAAGDDHSVFVKNDGTLWTTGDNSWGQLGDGTFTDCDAPECVASNAVAVAANWAHSLFIKNDGTLWGMGDNSFGELGGGGAFRWNLPGVMASNVVAVAASAWSSLYIKSDGTLWGLGGNRYGELGNGSNPMASNVVAVAAGSFHTLYLTGDGTLWAMGANADGELGDGTTNNVSVPESISSNVVAIAAGNNFSLFVKNDGTLWTMGANGWGQLGNGTTISQSQPGCVASNVVAVTAGSSFSLFLTSDGTMWVMGDNTEGQLGDGTTVGQISPEAITSVSLANVISGSMASHTVAVGISLAPIITSQPVSQTVLAGTPVSFTVTATDTGPITYQWQDYGDNIDGATNATYTIPSADFFDEGWYSAVVTGLHGYTVSRTAVLMVTNLPVPMSTITVTVDPPEAGFANGGGDLPIGDFALLMAIANPGWAFDHWSDGSTDNPYDVVVPATDTNYTAYFAPAVTLTVMASPPEGGFTTGSGTFPAGSTNPVTATASPGWIFTGWSDGTTGSSDSVVVSSNQTVTAYFAPAANVTIVVYPTNAGVVVTGGGTYQIGDNATLTASILSVTNQNGWKFLNWNGTVTNYTRTGDTNNPLGFTVTSDITVTANCAQVTSDGFVYTYIWVQPGGQIVNAKSNAKNRFTPQDETLVQGIEIIGYVGVASSIVIPGRIDGVPVNEIGPGALSQQHLEKVTIDDDTFGEDGTDNLTIDGTDDGAGSIDTEIFDVANLSDFDGLLETGELVIEGGAVVDCSEVLIPAAATGAALGIIGAVFSDLALVQVNASPSNGGQGNGTGLYFNGLSVEISAAPNDGWRFSGWSDGVTNKTRTVVVAGADSYTANFIQQSRVTVVAAPTNEAGAVTGEGIYDVGTIVPLTATANKDWEFHNWSDGSVEETNEIEVPDHDVTYTATFYVEVEGEAEPPIAGVILGKGSYPEGSPVALTAVALPGWEFKGWVLEALTTNSLLTNFITVIVSAEPMTPPLSYKAHFDQIVEVTGLASPTNAGSVEGSGTYEVDDTNITLTAIASNHWAFVQWDDGTTNNPCTITVPAEVVLEDIFTNIVRTAIFAATADITVLTNPIAGGSVTGGGTFLVGSTNPISAVASNGWAFTGWNDGNTNTPRFIVVTSNQTFTANFAPVSTVIGLANPTNAGMVTGGGVYFVGSNAVLTATASNAWQFINWNDGATNNPHSITVPATNITCTANFAATTIVTVNAQPSIGGSVTGGGAFLVGSTNLITASAADGWLFLGWNDGTTTSRYYIIVPATNSTFTAGFTAANPTNITASASGKSLTLTWPANHQGWILQVLTNDLSSTNWFDLPGTGGTNSAAIPLNPTSPPVFYRLRQP